MILDSRESNGAELLTSLGLTFAVTLSVEEGGEVHELKEDGTNIPVTPDNVYEYVKKYSELRMIDVCKTPLEVRPSGRGVGVVNLFLIRRCEEVCRRWYPSPSCPH